ncbi:MAG TPA: nucleotidyltransferase family protein [Pyrinomonadaceae bacterium]|jgi:hypothetical protein|nr:nucleotidyltransferase family protein [Pyrinomonadaceae bacterium]
MTPGITESGTAAIEARNGAPPHTPSENALLLCCARRRLKVCDDGDDELRRLIPEIKDWDYVLRTAARHGLTPFLFWQLKAACDGPIPASFMDKLSDQFHRNAAGNLLLTAELRSISGLFEEHGISAVPYKGPALALLLYGDTAFRRFDDLDLLLRRRDIPKATALLLSIGYRSPYTMSCAREAAYLETQRQQLFAHPGRRVCVELHWGFAQTFLAPSLDSDHFWGRLSKGSLEGVWTNALAPEDLLLVLCVHGCKHLWERLAWLCDVAELVAAHPGMDWEKLLAEARALGVRRMLSLGLFLAHDLLDAPLPEAVRRDVHDDAIIKSLSGRVRANLFTENLLSHGPSRSLLFHYEVRERRLDGARYCYHITIPPTPAEWTALDLPDPFSFLYYLVRPLRLIKKHSAAQLKRLAGFRLAGF